MGDYLITAPDGRKFKVSGPDQAGAMQALQQHLGIAAAENVTAPDGNQYTPEQMEIAKRFREQGGEDFQREQFAAQHPAASKAAKFVQGVPFVGEYADEAAGLVSSNPEAAELVRAMQAREDRVNPKSSMALELAGGLTGAGIAAAAAGPAIIANAPASMLGKVGAGIGAGVIGGGVEGGVSGYGAGTDLGSRKASAIERAALGSGFGAVFGGGAPMASRAAEAGVKTVQGVSNRLRGRTVQGVSQPAQEIVGRALGPNAGGAQTAINMNRGGPDAMLADATEGTRSLLDTAIASSGGGNVSAARSAVEDRVTRANQNMRSVMDDVLGAPAGVRRSEIALQRGTAPARKAAYEAAYNTPINYGSEAGARLRGLLDRVPKGAFKTANKLMKAEGVSSKQWIGFLDAQGIPTGANKLPDVRQIDYITRALRDVADKQDSKGKLGGQTNLGRVYSGLAKDIRKLLKSDDLVPEYGIALDTAADPISRRIALRDGQKKFLSPSLTRDEAEEMVDGMSRAEMSALKQGIRSSLDDKMANIKRLVSDPNQDARQAKLALTELSSDAARDKMSMVLSAGEHQRLFKEIDRNLLGFELRAAVATNSKTAIRTATDAVVKDFSQGGAIRQAASGQPIISAKRVVQLLTKNTPEDKLAREDELYSEIVDVLTRARGNDAKILLRTLSQINLRQPINVGMAKRVGNIIGGGGAALGYQSGVQSLTE